MPVKSGGSHSFSAFGSMVVAAIISKYVWEAAPSFARMSRLAGDVLVTTTGVEFAPEFVGQVFIATGLAFVWGVLYHVSRH
ncbi:hypothetical protein [Halorussus amylolyticus]|uniref:hypothetical protein n=1 Tax=Halorussus amylolyticus TaxID=1126242 RepID=UPI0010461A86|nr:hypothetical protein [Halorussus amylolyticus]